MSLPRRAWTGRGLFVLGLAAWAWLGARLLPYDCLDLCYLFSLERGDWVQQEWVHPLYVPALRVFQALWRLCGGAGPMLVPVESLNLGLGGLTLALMFFLVEEKCGDSLFAAAGALLFGFSPGFRYGCLRSTPYAAASLAALASLALMLGLVRRAQKRRWLLAGAAAGAAAGLHVSALALIAPAWLARRNRGDFRNFLGAFAATLALSYLWFVLSHHIDQSYFQKNSLRDLFNGIEQVSGTSIFSNPVPVRQFSDYWATLAWQGRVLLAVGVVLIASRFFAGPEDSLGQEGALAAANAAGFSIFFLINNTGNGFAFASFLLVPLALARLCAGSRAWRLGLAAAALATLLEQGGAGPDPFLQETRFLRAKLGDDGVLLVPGCPAPELFYFGHLHVLAVSGDSPDSDPLRCVAPSVAPGPALRARIDDALSRGAPVLLAAGVDSVAGGGDEAGRFKQQQIFRPWRNDFSIQRRDAARLFELLDPEEARSVYSPRGAKYFRLRRAGLSRPARRPDLDAAAIARQLKPFLARPGVGRRAEYLEAWLAASPRDAFALEDLAELARRAAAGGRGRRWPYYDQAMKADAEGRGDEALRLFSRAIEADPGDAEAYLSRGTLHGARGDWQKALADYDKGLALGPASRQLREALVTSRGAALRRLAQKRR